MMQYFFLSHEKSQLLFKCINIKTLGVKLHSFIIYVMWFYLPEIFNGNVINILFSRSLVL